MLQRLLAVAVLALASLAHADDKPATARLVYYSGRVQGVGFRATAVMIAAKHPVTGWVKNLPDGRVQLVVEGSADSVQDFLRAIRAYWKEQISREEITEQPATGKFTKFTIER